MEYLVLQLRLNFGPLLDLMNTGLYTAESGRMLIEQLIEDVCTGKRYFRKGSSKLIFHTVSVGLLRIIILLTLKNLELNTLRSSLPNFSVQ